MSELCRMGKQGSLVKCEGRVGQSGLCLPHLELEITRRRNALNIKLDELHEAHEKLTDLRAERRQLRAVELAR